MTTPNTLREKWRGTGLYKIVRDAVYSSGEPIEEDLFKWFISQFSAEIEGVKMKETPLDETDGEWNIRMGWNAALDELKRRIGV